mmetsp:Transcript_37882/g.55818  ORF Transcript_37882/g.55818 Transcript_37882/m.55818 type:complete len:104 (+) Transcript_37882:169-480(+)|eukprot:CAMPEP_0195520658 /NCGR_PEP_ID=MMETSP0794_2-20130614/17393_1 /TAXON_ID=515487 /ORGANISM="Stephanopyxis turris, Strain CCMP 815" /LENGTH=103 /DNA_ID=CAMNT_0040650069 /DNA_START=165 /DNA_END=476 /DNA_ORIENTATION=+
MMQAWKALTGEQRYLWKIVGGIFLFGHGPKLAYFHYVSEVTKDALAASHLAAVKHSEETDRFAKKLSVEHSRRVPPLTTVQKEQLRRYLSLRRTHRPDLHPPE